MSITIPYYDPLTTREREDSRPDHRIFAVMIELPFTIERQDAPSTDDDGNDSTVQSWGVWDHRVADWAGEGNGVEFGTLGAARRWLDAALPSLFA
jgi:hypothetical protein